MKLLAVDCSASLCAACVYDTATSASLGRHVRDLGKGHAEHLLAVIDKALSDAGMTYADLDAIAVSTGPGSFTGIRVGVSAVRGLALALKIPAIGVTTLEALAAEAATAFPGRAVLSALDGGRGEIHAALFGADGETQHGPAIVTLSEAALMATENAVVLAGTAAETVADAAGGAFDFGPLAATADIATYARLAALKGPGEKPRPVYLREADAKPQAGFVLPRVG